MLVVSCKGVNYGFWFHFGCPEQNTNIFRAVKLGRGQPSSWGGGGGGGGGGGTRSIHDRGVRHIFLG